MIEDLRRTRSVDSTVENILDGRLAPILPMFQQEPNPVSVHPTVARVESDPSPELFNFVEDPQERQQLLLCRKRNLMTEARNRYLLKQTQNTEIS